MHKQLSVVSNSQMANSLRPEIRNAQSVEEIRVVEKPRSLFDKLYGEDFVRKAFILIALALVWEGYGRWLDNELLFPTFGATMSAFAKGVSMGFCPAGHGGRLGFC